MEKRSDSHRGDSAAEAKKVASGKALQPTGTLLSDKEIRERLISRGADSLKDDELLSIFLHEGKNNDCSVLIARNLLETVGGIAGLGTTDIHRLRMSAGIGLKKAAFIASAVELGRRATVEKPAAPSVIRGNDDVLKLFRPHMERLQYEEFWVLYLSSANTVLDKAKVGQGGVSGITVDHKLIVKRAVELLATAVVLVHNHPSSVAQPSEEDKQITARIEAAAALFDISVHDHVIITAGDSFSFRKAGLLNNLFM